MKKISLNEFKPLKKIRPMRKIISLLLFVMLLRPVALFAQEKDEFFHEIEVAYTYLNNEKWRGVVAANWKHIYDEIGWRRWGGDAYISRKIKSIAIEAGLTANYTFDKDITNYLEIRPWFGLRSDLELTRRFLLMQKFKVENRNLLYNDRYKNETFLRSRYLLSLKYNFIKGREDWKLNPTGEWYFIGKKANAERFINSFELGLRLIKVFKNGHELALGYKIESFKQSEVTGNTGKGHIFILECGF
jgi:hypothetical protein